MHREIELVDGFHSLELSFHVEAAESDAGSIDRVPFEVQVYDMYVNA